MFPAIKWNRLESSKKSKSFASGIFNFVMKTIICQTLKMLREPLCDSSFLRGEKDCGFVVKKE
jgi:hypothetical protein